MPANWSWLTSIDFAACNSAGTPIFASGGMSFRPRVVAGSSARICAMSGTGRRVLDRLLRLRDDAVDRLLRAVQERLQVLAHLRLEVVERLVDVDDAAGVVRVQHPAVVQRGRADVAGDELDVAVGDADLAGE